MIKKKITKRRNPQFHNEIRKLIDSKVIVQLSSEYGSFGAEGILQKEITNYKLDFSDKNSSFNIVFNDKLIKKIDNNVIILHSLSENLLKFSNLYGNPRNLIGKRGKVIINHDLWFSWDLYAPSVSGNIYYDKIFESFYIQKLNKFWLRFKEESILQMTGLGDSYYIMIQI